MKKIIYTLLALALTLSIGNTTAQASEQSNFKLHGLVLVAGQFGESFSLYHEESDQKLHPFVLAQRVQFGTIWTPNEKTSFNMFVRVPGEMVWGNTVGNKSFETKNYMAVKIANIDWKPTDDFRLIIGRFFFRGPDHGGFIGFPIQQDFTDGLRVLGNIGSKWSYDLTWGRNMTSFLEKGAADFSYDALKGKMDFTNSNATGTVLGDLTYYGDDGYNWNSNSSEQYSTSPSAGLNWFVASAAFKGDTFEFKPYTALTILAKDAAIYYNFPRNQNFLNLTGDTTYLYWGGFTTKVKLDGISFGLDAVINGNQVDYHDGGFLVDAFVRKTMKNFNLNLIGWYANGNKEDQIAGIQTVCFDGVLGHVNSKYLGWGIMPFAIGSGVGSPVGTTGVGFEVANIKPFTTVPVTFNANLSYINGTNHVDFTQTGGVGPYNLETGLASYLTTKDHLVDVGMNCLFVPQPNLLVAFEMNYLMPHLGREGAKQTKNGYHFGVTTQFNM